MSKGSARRKGEGFADGWDRIFGKKDALEGESMTGWPPGLLQDDSYPLAHALSSKPDAREHVRDVAGEYLRGIPPIHPVNDGYSYALTYGKAMNNKSATEPQPKTCQHCKHWKPPCEGLDMQCSSPDVWEMMDGDTQAVNFVTTADWGCMSWEAKL